MVDPVTVGTIAAPIVGGILGGKKGRESGRTAEGAGREAAQRIEDSWREAEGIYKEEFQRAIEALEAGNAEFAETILEGLGLSNEEIDKAVDLSLDALEWVVDFGKAGIDDFEGRMREANKYMDYHKQLVFNPDAIYGTQAYQSIKKRTEQEWDNYYSGKGMLGGNASEALADRMFQLGAGFRQNELTNALSGAQANQALAGTRLQQVGLGAQASGQGAENIFRGGLQKGLNTMNAYGAIGEGDLQTALALGQLYEGGGRYLSEGEYGSGQAAAEALLAGALGKSVQLGRTGNALLGGSFNLLGDVLGRQPSISSGGGQASIPFGGGFAPTNNSYYMTNPYHLGGVT